MKKLKTTLLLVATTLAIIVTNAQETTVTIEFDNAETALEVVKKYVTALHEGDADRMSAQLAEKATVYGLNGGPDSLTVTEHTNYYTRSVATYDHTITNDLYLPVKVENNWNEGEWILTWGTNTITHKKTGAKTIIPYHTANLVQNGKIILMQNYYDLLNVVKTQGLSVNGPIK
ncbi:nuclear transport factor 2 family protein [Zobellia amurskyensis]|uniref:Nuclear transport factor 2 family protein n=1 Tax=Zobellia amurskyensis TaxID=248905 RepID=A0A7X2ZT38_9FLAO|nr:nuclear transport factor 2 family protein [Zobellia amurskyensis]MUH35895.1 nuclear transport factor 2 family protein [Zobellia amurskyensis]